MNPLRKLVCPNCKGVVMLPDGIVVFTVYCLFILSPSVYIVTLPLILVNDPIYDS